MDPYQMLGITKGCDAEELKEAFRAKALLVHPDRGGDAADFIRLRQAYDQIATELRRRPQGPSTGSSGGDTHRDRYRRQPDPNWEADLIVPDEPLPRLRPACPPDPDWEPDLIVRDEPLPRIRPPRPPDSSWKPDFFLGEDDVGNTPVPPPGPASGAVQQQHFGALRSVVTRSQAEAPSEREGWYAFIGLTAIVSVIMLGIWMASPLPAEVPRAEPADLTPSPWLESLPRAQETRVPDRPESSSKTRQLLPR
jgi:hypothetical protein